MILRKYQKITRYHDLRDYHQITFNTFNWDRIFEEGLKNSIKGTRNVRVNFKYFNMTYLQGALKFQQDTYHDRI